MTDTTATPAATTAATTEPAAATSQGAGTMPTKPIQVAQPSPNEKLAAALKEMGGLEVTAGGAKHKIDSVDALIRHLQRGIPVDSVLKQVSEEKSKLQPFAEAVKALQSGDDAAAEQILEQMLGPQRLRSVAEARLRREFEQEKQLQGMTPRERELHLQLQKLQGDKAGMEKAQKAYQEQQAQAAQQQAVAQIQQHIGSNVEGALKLLGIDAKDATLVPAAIKHMRPTIEAMLSNNIPLDPQRLADAVRPEFEAAIQFMTKNLDGDALLKLLGEGTGKKVRNALLAQLKGGGAAPARATQGGPTVTPSNEGDKPAKLDFRKPIF